MLARPRPAARAGKSMALHQLGLSRFPILELGIDLHDLVQSGHELFPRRPRYLKWGERFLSQYDPGDEVIFVSFTPILERRHGPTRKLIFCEPFNRRAALMITRFSGIVVHETLLGSRQSESLRGRHDANPQGIFTYGQ